MLVASFSIQMTQNNPPPVVQILEESFLDSTTTTPIYFILSPGANVVGDLDKLADKYDFVKNESYHNVSMGQGQVGDRVCR